tara:strand:+ start:45 stop:887 length:843 start_codon:yes stop_codon:yes gene_type:complete
MATIASPSSTTLYLNAFDKTIQCGGVTKTVDDDYWTKEIVPILYPMWDSDNDKLEVFVQYKDGSSRMNKTKYSRNQKTGVYKWISYQFDLTPFTTEITDLTNRLVEKFTEYRQGQENDLERALAASFSQNSILNWTKVALIRNFLLMDSDWTQLGDAPVTAEQKTQWQAYRQKLRDIPAEQKNKSANTVVFPITPSKHAKLDDGLTYLDDVSHYYTIPQSVYSKFTTRIVNYLALAIGTIDIDEMPVTRIARPMGSINPNTGDNTLDDILKMIDEGDFGE